MVAIEAHSGKAYSLWAEELYSLRQAPFDTGPDSLFVAYSAQAELSCFLELGWPMPHNVLDLRCEFQAIVNGSGKGGTKRLIDALEYYGLARIIQRI
jgi:DNA polymerase I